MAAWLSLFGVAAWAEFPALYDVTGVSSGDVLNIRAGPGTAHADRGDLVYDATRIEVLGREGDWLRINFDGAPAWVSARFMTRQEGAAFPDHPVICHGTEPFWSLSRAANGALRFERPGAEALALEGSAAIRSANRADVAHFSAASGDARFDAILRKGSCSDGMSDLGFGLSIDLLRRDPNGTRLLSGCCALN
ncbi:SH3 domain-containing protein [Poseidonocella sedimentorum]|uniref:SH3 domain-containing protein n=1 Tax=Poseidonocella sedimentorum TaxID=871652 RepID=UPI0015A590F0|nr:SH3 domain-containing protein [Poseidonocella sedimentorum]